ncbi:hypothetical protein K6T82_06905 [Flavobacterium sp. 17A]|uniref:PH domain-containing protein n=1 Tax=Flavobacterium potami TaxID=2872310 RepID=A0A9X1H870_9FLAO|nr:hypothetical protein [Flavobacterium potami]MBZ4034488.1 hypothetical protein [Flavobacterium potami]
MKPITKNKILLLAYILCIGLLAFYYFDKLEESWEKPTFLFVVMATILLAITNSNRVMYYTLLGDSLIINRIVSKQKQLNLKTVVDWNENQYELFGIKTKRQIVLKTSDGNKISLFEKDSKDYKMLSDYLNQNIP